MDVKFEAKRKRETHRDTHRVRSLNFNGNVMPFLPCYKAYLKAILIKSKHSYFDDLLIFCVFDVYSSLFIFSSKTNQRQITHRQTIAMEILSEFIFDSVWQPIVFGRKCTFHEMNISWYFRHCHSSNKWI